MLIEDEHIFNENKIQSFKARPCNSYSYNEGSHPLQHATVMSCSKSELLPRFGHVFKITRAALTAND